MFIIVYDLQLGDKLVISVFVCDLAYWKIRYCLEFRVWNGSFTQGVKRVFCSVGSFNFLV